MTHEEEDIRHLREQLVRFVIEQLKQADADGTLQKPLADLRRALDADVRQTVEQTLAASGFGKGAVRLDEASVEAVAGQLHKLIERERASWNERERLAHAPAGESARTELTGEQGFARGGDGSAVAARADRQGGYDHGSQRRSRPLRDRLAGGSDPLLARIAMALAALVIALLLYLAYDKLGGGAAADADPGGAGPAVEAGATRLPEKSNPFEAAPEPEKGSGDTTPAPQGGGTSNIPRGG